MSRIPIDNLGSVGLIRDVFNQDVSPAGWTDMRNARMGPYGAEKFLGHVRSLGTTTTGWTQNPTWLFWAQNPGTTGYWIGCGTTKVYVRSTASPWTETDISRVAAYGATEALKWNGGRFGKWFILNNGVDVPQVWQGGPFSSGTALVNMNTLGASPWDATHRAAVMKPFGNFLVGLNITKGATNYPQLIKWSHPGDVSTFPATWDPTDTTKDAGEYSILDMAGLPLNQLRLRDLNLIYTTDQVWRMAYVGGNDIFGFAPLFNTHGILAEKYVAGFRKDTEYHLAMSGDDLYLHNGQAPQSIITPRLRRWFFQQIDPTYYARGFIIANPRFSEVWVCIPESGAEQPTLALVWNWETGGIGFRDLLKETSQSDTRTGPSSQGTPSIAQGFMDDTGTETWDSDTDSWDSDTSQWNQGATNPAMPLLLMQDRSAGKRTFLLDYSSGFDTASIPFYLERTSLALSGTDRNGNPVSDTELLKTLTELWPRIESSEGLVLTINVGTQLTPDGAVTWSQDYTYTVGTDIYTPVYQTSRYISVRFSNTSTTAFRIMGYALNITANGYF